MDPEDVQGPDRTHLDWNLDCLEWDELPDDMPRVSAYVKIAYLVQILIGAEKFQEFSFYVLSGCSEKQFNQP